MHVLVGEQQARLVWQLGDIGYGIVAWFTMVAIALSCRQRCTPCGTSNAR
ncbi:hypothetical protein [Streptomyces peucetius]|uniref:Uncharacterized protein n=1 Tax=Streptomyces peucetius TaxID=1950 RepID=A0ABY6I102_STRPE|nr:hypothetical protein [Streptomyces peucetius]UYQ60444.1 hypothetical protein OGH68_02425 [Streptomyces peucetius]